MHARRTAVASAVCSAGILACPVTSARRYQLHQSFLRAGHADVQRVVGEEVEVGRTSTSELTCDAGTLGALSAGDLGRYLALAAPRTVMVPQSMCKMIFLPPGGQNKVPQIRRVIFLDSHHVKYITL